MTCSPLHHTNRVLQHFIIRSHIFACLLDAGTVHKNTRPTILLTFRHRTHRFHSRIGGSSRLSDLFRYHRNNLPLNSNTRL